MTLLHLLSLLDGHPTTLRDFCRRSKVFELGHDRKTGLTTVRLSSEGEYQLKLLRAKRGAKATKAKPEAKRTDAQLAAEVNRAAEYRWAAREHKAAWDARRQGQTIQQPAHREGQAPVWNGGWFYPGDPGYQRAVQAQAKPKHAANVQPAKPKADERLGPFWMPRWPW